MTRPAMPSDWETTPMPTQHLAITLDRSFSVLEMERIRQGVVPEQMEDKWFVYWHDGTLYFYRSWTGFCVFVVHFAVEGESCRMVGAEVNRDPEQVGEPHGRDDELISYLIDALLLRHDAELPSDEPDEGQRALETWSFVGRAMLGDHPAGE